MGRRNRKKVNGISFPAPFAVGILLIAFMALVYVWLGGRCDALGRELKALEKEREELNKRYQAEEYRWVRVKSPANVEQALLKLGITMGWPRKDQIIRLSESDVRFAPRDPEVARGLSHGRSDQKSL